MEYGTGKLRIGGIDLEEFTGLLRAMLEEPRHAAKPADRIETLREIVGLLREVGSYETLPDAANTLATIESETDVFPVGEFRAFWSATALRKKDHELQQYLNRVDTDLESACRQILALLSAEDNASG